MSRQIFVHLSTKDVQRARAFYTALGGETYNLATKDVNENQSRWFTIACPGSAADKLRRAQRLEGMQSHAYESLYAVVAAALGTSTATTLLATYLGADAGRRVLQGAIARGEAEHRDRQQRQQSPKIEEGSHLSSPRAFSCSATCSAP